MKKTKLLSVYKIALLIFALTLVLMPKNVTAMPEIETKLLLTAIGIDKTESGYTVSATDVMPAESQDGTLRRLSVRAEGSSVSECLNKLSVKMGKKLELGLCGLVAIGNTYEGESVLPDLRYLLSSGRIISGAYLVYCPSDSASEMLEKANELSAASSNGLANLLEHNAVENNTKLITLLKFLSDSASVTKSSFMPCVEIVEKKPRGGEAMPSGDDSGQSELTGENKQKETEIESLSEVALFKEGKKLMRLSEAQTRGLTWLDERSTHGLVTLNELYAGGEYVGELHAKLTDKKLSFKPSFKSSPSIRVKLSVSLSLEDRHKLTELHYRNGVSEGELSSSMLTGFENQIKNEIQTLIDCTKDIDCDAVGLTDLLYRTRNKKYKELARHLSVYPMLEISYDISVKIN